MHAMLLRQLTDLTVNPKPLEYAYLPIPKPGAGEILLRVVACGVCHTELDEIEGRTPPPYLPVIPGHQVVGRVVERGDGSDQYLLGEHLGVAWIYGACGECQFCRTGQENLCSEFRATGRDAHGGYAEYMLVPEAFAYPIPAAFNPVEAAPLLCAGAIGYRSLKLSNLPVGGNLGLSGFGASAHIVLKLVKTINPQARSYVFSRSPEECEFALELGATWAGNFDQVPPEALDAIIDTTPAWKPIVNGLACLKPGGRLVINAIRKENIDRQVLLNLDYPSHLWLEKEIKSVANITRQDVREFLELASQVPIRPEVQLYSLEEANRALVEMKERKIRGAKVITLE